MEAQLLWPLVGFALFAFLVRRYLSGRVLRSVRGPPASSWLMGHYQELCHQLEVGDIDTKWSAEYGTVWRVKGCMGEDLLWIADPKALHHIFHKPGYHFPKTAAGRQFVREITGPGILSAEGQEHARIRKIMNPAFTAGQLKSFLPLFRASAQKLGQKWKDLLETEGTSVTRIDVLAWLERCTLDIIGEVGFDVKCGALDDSLNPVMEAYKNMFIDTISCPSKLTVLTLSLLRYIPMPIFKFFKYIPTREHKRLRETLKTINAFAKLLIDEKTEAVLAGGEKKKDIMSILIKASAAQNPSQRLTDEEMISLFGTFLLAGNETMASSMAWLLYELARHPEYQAKMRGEISAIRARVAGRGDDDFAVSDLDSMTYCQAAMKEVLRLHPIVASLEREAGRDEVIPLTNPITTSSGKAVTEIPIPKGTNVIVSVWQYNRLPEIWGPDAQQFNPKRFIEHEKMGQTYVGVTSNLMTFSAGMQACIGWRFSIIEMQAILVELLENFEFAIPEDKPEIMRFPGAFVAPLVKSDMMAGPQMPLHVSLVQ